MCSRPSWVHAFAVVPIPLTFIVIFVFVVSKKRTRVEIKPVELCVWSGALTDIHVYSVPCFSSMEIYFIMRIYEETNIHKRLNGFSYFCATLLTRVHFHAYSLHMCHAPTLPKRYAQIILGETYIKIKKIRELVICAPNMQ